MLIFITLNSYAYELDEEVLTTEFYLSYDLDKKTILYKKNINEPISPASITKLMTALILYENNELNELISINYPDSYNFEGKVAYFCDYRSYPSKNALRSSSDHNSSFFNDAFNR